MSEPTASARADVIDDLPDPRNASNVEYMPSLERLRELSQDLETTTEFGSPSYVSDYRSRCADLTRNTVDDDFTAEDYEAVDAAYEATRDAEMVCLDLRMGGHPAHSYVCRYYVERPEARIALALTRLFPRVEEDVGSEDVDLLTMQIPSHPDVAIRVLVEEGVTAVLGSDYTGEAKKSFLRLFMYDVKQNGGLGLHAGSKRVRLKEGDDTREVGQIFLGLSATGKSTLTAHGLGLEDPEDAVMLQDDVCGLTSDGTVVGSEPNGLYLKTIGLDSDRQPEVYHAVTDGSSVLENVDVADDGEVEFDSDRHTSNGRAAVLRDNLESAASEIDLDRVDQVFFITRNPLMPPIAKLSPEEAAAAFVLGESIETSAGDPENAGEAVRVVGTNPFIVGSEGMEGNRFRDLVAGLDVECYVINTGTVGGRDVGVEETTGVLEAVARRQVEWKTDDTGLTVPSDVPGVDIDDFRVSSNVEDHEQKVSELRGDRREYLDSFDDLYPEIADAVY